ncbi:Macrolide export protein MacA [Stieleria maiorica]|uniref:Macrolide export protein MacA n=1 Tax=Stieleria maiorica TaxID=2795974 RepID=A0A5B9MG12_9BACT|nr:efflux RND transporter periplasmic adaptor subunit [Stieleria maiorica]QEF98960.1 Macrolide export protein MacA [Stieleria maiorica]
MRFSLKTLLWGILAIALAMVAAAALFPDPVAVRATRATSGPLRVSVVEDGKTRIREKYTVSAPVSGRLSRIELREGDYIDVRRLLAVILPSDPALLDQRSLAEAQARVQAAEAAVLRADSRERQAEIDFDLSRTKFERAQRLMPQNGISRDEYDIAESVMLADKQAIETAAFDAEISRFELKLAKAALDQFEGEDPNVQVSPFEIFSPIEGRVLRVLEKSSTVVAVGTPLIEVGDPRNLEMEIDVLSTDAVKIRSGAEVTIEHWGGQSPLRGSVRVVEPGAFTKISSLGVEEQRVNVIADFNEPPDRIASLGDGYRIEARITVKQLDNALLIPNNALFRYEQQWHVLVVQDGAAQLRKVEVGVQNESHAEIVSGLAEGERVIEYPSDQLEPGTPVTVVAK